MSCLARHEITRAATIGAGDPHFTDCLPCRRQLEEESEMRRLLGKLPEPRLAPARRRELAAELSALAERARPRRRTWGHVTGIAIASAAGLGLVFSWPRPTTPTAPVVSVAVQEAVASPIRHTAVEVAPPRLGPPRIAARSDARLSQQTGDDRDVVALSDGLVEIDSRDARDVDVRIGTTIVHVGDAQVRIRAHAHAIVSVHVVVGAVRIDNADRRLVVERGAIWTAEPPAQRAAAASLRAFRDGWIALRAGRDAEALALFDAATDGTVAEEAAYWAAIAAKRAGNDLAARARLNDFIERFPLSPYVAKARAALTAAGPR